MSVIISAARTPIGKFGGVFRNMTAVQLGAAAVKETVRRSGLKPEDFDLAIIGQVLQAGCGQIPSRQVTAKAGLPETLPSETLNKVCASSFRAVTQADALIRAGDAQTVIAGGMESMSNSPFALPGMRWGQRMFNGSAVDLMVHDGLWCAAYDRHMAVHGGVLAKEFGISREEQDLWAYNSQMKADAAVKAGRLNDEIVPLAIPGKKGDTVVDKDETLRPETTLEGLAKLPALFAPENTVTAGNAPATNDAAGAMVIMDDKEAEKRGIKPLARIMSSAMVAEDPQRIATVPGIAINKLLKKTGMSIGDIDLVEINEAFAAVTLVSGKIIGCDMSRVNVNGGAVAFGHPIGASGARIIMTLAYEMRRRKAEWGIAAICSGAAQGDAILLKRDD